LLSDLAARRDAPLTFRDKAEHEAGTLAGAVNVEQLAPGVWSAPLSVDSVMLRF
jgi:hypothetical protein